MDGEDLWWEEFFNDDMFYYGDELDEDEIPFPVDIDLD